MVAKIGSSLNLSPACNLLLASAFSQVYAHKNHWTKTTYDYYGVSSLIEAEPRAVDDLETLKSNFTIVTDKDKVLVQGLESQRPRDMNDFAAHEKFDDAVVAKSEQLAEAVQRVDIAIRSYASVRLALDYYSRLKNKAKAGISTADLALLRSIKKNVDASSGYNDARLADPAMQEKAEHLCTTLAHRFFNED